MIDLHCHLFPGIDDGPSDLFAALDLARQAVEDGVTHSIVTPHMHFGRWDNSLASIRAAAAEFRSALHKAQIPLTIGFAAEIRICTELMSMLPEREIPYVGTWEGQRVVLLELPHSHILPGTDRIVRWLMDRGVLPMIAHPERNKDVMRRLDKILPLIDLGCLLQITAGSIVGQFGPRAQQRAATLLNMGAVTVIASDAHHVKRRPVNLGAGRDAAAQLIGKKEAETLVYANPLKLAREHFTVGTPRPPGNIVQL